MEDVPNVSDLCSGRYVLYKYTEKKFYVGYAIGQSEDDVTVKLARKYAAVRNRKFTFVWPEIDDVVVVDSSVDNILQGLPNPVMGRRGTSITFNMQVFGKIPDGYIY